MNFTVLADVYPGTESIQLAIQEAVKNALQSVVGTNEVNAVNCIVGVQVIDRTV